MQYKVWVKTATLLVLTLVVISLSGCGSKLVSVRKVENEKMVFDLKECKRVDGNLECVIDIKTKTKIPKFYIRTKKAYHPKAIDQEDKLMTADAYYINGVNYFKKWIHMGAFKNYPTLIVFPNLAKDANLIKKIEFLFTTQEKENWKVEFTNIEMSS